MNGFYCIAFRKFDQTTWRLVKQDILDEGDGKELLDKLRKHYRTMRIHIALLLVNPVDGQVNTIKEVCKGDTVIDNSRDTTS